MRRQYYSLMVKYEGNLWTPEFGDYNLDVVKAEQEVVSERTGEYATVEYTCIVQTDGTQPNIEMAADELNRNDGMKYKQEYLQADGGHFCPFCGSFNLSFGSVEIEANNAIQEVSCDDCEAEWYDVYMRQGVQVTTTPEKY